MARALLLRHGEAGQWARAWLPLPTRPLSERLRSDRGDPARPAPAQVSAAAARALRRRPSLSGQVGATEQRRLLPRRLRCPTGRGREGLRPCTFLPWGSGTAPAPGTRRPGDAGTPPGPGVTRGEGGRSLAGLGDRAGRSPLSLRAVAGANLLGVGLARADGQGPALRLYHGWRGREPTCRPRARNGNGNATRLTGPR